MGNRGPYVYIDDVVTSCQRGREAYAKARCPLQGATLSSGDLCRHPRVNFNINPADSFCADRNGPWECSLCHQVVEGGPAKTGHFLHYGSSQEFGGRQAMGALEEGRGLYRHFLCSGML